MTMKKGSHYITRAIDGGSNAPLSNEQKAKICIRAGEAYEHMRRQGLIHQDVALEDWRRDQQMSAVDCDSLRQCTQKDFDALMAHFENLLGNSDKAFSYSLRAENSPRNVALHNLRKACMEAKGALRDPMGYVRGYLRRAKGLALEDADAKTIWGCVFMIRRKTQKTNITAKAGGVSAGGTVDDVLDSLGIPKAGAGAPVTKPAGAKKGGAWKQPKSKGSKKPAAPPSTPAPSADEPW